MSRLVLGSRNAKKLRELVALLGDLPLELTDLSPYPDAPEVVETGDTFEANARLKAAAQRYMQATDRPAKRNGR